MAGSLFVLPRVTPLNGSVGVPLSKLTFSKTGTSTAQNTYSDSALTTPNANPMVADANGVFGKIYLDPSTGFDYRVKWTTTADVLIWQEDDIKAGNTVSASYTLTDAAPFIDLIETDASANNGAWRIKVNSEQLAIYAMNDAKSVLTPILTVDRTGTTVDSINLVAATNQSNGGTIATQSSGSFTGTLTGCTTSPTQTFYWTISGQIATLSLRANINGTSNATSMNITGIPAAIQPAHGKAIYCTYIRNNSVQFLDGYAYVDLSSALLFFLEDGASFTGSGTKGLDAGWSITYGLD